MKEVSKTADSIFEQVSEHYNEKMEGKAWTGMTRSQIINLISRERIKHHGGSDKFRAIEQSPSVSVSTSDERFFLQFNVTKTRDGMFFSFPFSLLMFSLV